MFIKIRQNTLNKRTQESKSSLLSWRDTHHYYKYIRSLKLQLKENWHLKVDITIVSSFTINHCDYNFEFEYSYTIPDTLIW